MTDVDVGAWGGDGGVNPWRYKPNGRFTEILIYSGDCIDSIRFTYIDSDKITHHSDTYGGGGGSAQTITFAAGESIIGISGTVGPYSDVPEVITSLSFETNKNTFGPYGTTGGTPFSLPVANGKFVGFTGNYGDVLDSFGAILSPSSS